jgi:CBS domain-containing protein
MMVLMSDRADRAETTRALTVSDAMSARVIHCTPDTPLRGVARLMATHGIHGVYVFDYGAEDDEATRLWGLVTDLDLVAAWPVIDDRTAGNSAITPLVTVSRAEPVGRAAQLMAETGSTHLAVLDPASGRPVGVLSTMDVARVIAAARDATETTPG